ncbi:MAG: glycosyltransferase family 4 protein [Treponema sp.]|nr:glycosyltransferase family 4 protein [Treponema sp.]
MKIAVDCRMFGASGIGTYIKALVPFFLAKHECVLFGNTHKLAPYESNAEICECAVKPFSLKELLAFPRALRKKINSCDIYYTPYCNIPCGITIPIFSTIHDIVFLDVQGLASPGGVAARKFFYQRAINKSRALFTVSQFSASRIRKKLNCKNLPIIVTYGALSQHFSSKHSHNVQKNAQILYVGNIKKHKGLHILLAAFKKAQGRGLAAKLIIVGSTDNFRTSDMEIMQKITELPSNSVQFTGHISDQELRKLYMQSHVLVQPSLYEGFGLPPLEAMSLGTHALLSDIPVFKEIYGNFPVTFFESGNDDDLAIKMIACMNDKTPLPPLPATYTWKKSSDIILAAFSLYNSKQPVLKPMFPNRLNT